VYLSTTLEDLLRHRSGLPPFTHAEEVLAVPPLTGTVMEQRATFCRWVFTQPNVAVPRDTNIYSNAGYVVAATMLEQLYNNSYENLLQEKILSPLYMPAIFGWPGTNRMKEPWGHIIGQSGMLEPVDPNNPDNENPPVISPAGNLSMNIENYAGFLQVILKAKKGDPAILTENSYIKLLTPESGFGMGWVVMDADGTRLLGHAGSAGSFYAVAVLDFQNDLAFAVFTNSSSDDIAMKMAILPMYLRYLSLQ
jgi:CubicO group peptidase (beta-lactamase class C family)